MPPPVVTISFPSHLGLEPLTFDTGLFINNKFVEGEDHSTFETINPSSEQCIGMVSEAKAKDIDIAVVAAQKAFAHVWGLKTPGFERGKMLIELAEAIESEAPILAAIETIDNGKAYGIAKNFDVPYAAAWLRYYGGWADKNHGQTLEVDESKLAFTIHEPLGVVGQIIPWNFPLVMLAMKLGPALATGNTVVVKPAEQTPLSALYACRLIQKIFPPGVVNVLPGYGPTAGEALLKHPLVEKVHFTGSTAVGRRILKLSGTSNLKKLTLELGGKSPSVIFEDANLEQAVKWTAFGAMFNQGQNCVSGSRVYVHEPIYDKFIVDFEQQLKNMEAGDPFSEATIHGPQISQSQFDRIMAYIQSGKEDGATCLRGGNRVGSKGYFIEPTLFVNANPSMKIMQEEIFGPVVVVCKFKDENEVVEQANDTIYGLSAAVFTRDIDKALKTARRLKAGTIWINCCTRMNPQVAFGGFKESGIGRENGDYALATYTAVKAVQVNLGEKL